MKTKIKKGVEVRIRRTNQIGVIKDVELIRKSGCVHKYCHVATPDGKPDMWMDSSELTDVDEKCVVRFANSDGQFLTLTVVQDHKKHEMTVSIGEAIPNNLKEQAGLHVLLLNKILASLTRQYDNVEMVSE